MTTGLYDLDDSYVYNSLRRALDRNDLVLFAGSGLSAQACTEDGRHPPEWEVLLERLLEWCLANRRIEPAHAEGVRELIRAGYRIDAGQELEEVLTPEELKRCLGNLLLCGEAKTGDAHALVAQVCFRAYLTTNYDEFLEGEFRTVRGVALGRFYEDTTADAQMAFREGEPFVLKLHGDINYSRPVVLGVRSYDRLLYSHSEYRFCLDHILASSTVLFVGFGCSDPHLEAVISRVATFDGRDKRHWILLPQGSFPRLRAHRLWKDRGINVVRYHPDAEHSGLVKFLRALASPAPLSPPVTEDQSSLKSLEIKEKIESEEGRS